MEHNGLSCLRGEARQISELSQNGPFTGIGLRGSRPKWPTGSGFHHTSGGQAYAARSSCKAQHSWIGAGPVHGSVPQTGIGHSAGLRATISAERTPQYVALAVKGDPVTSRSAVVCVKFSKKVMALGLGFGPGGAEPHGERSAGRAGRRQAAMRRTSFLRSRKCSMLR
jgi:hypothetical protein